MIVNLYLLLVFLLNLAKDYRSHWFKSKACTKLCSFCQYCFCRSELCFWFSWCKSSHYLCTCFCTPSGSWFV